MKNPILITGSHRSGSTWVGRMLSLASGVKYANEPFNPKFGLKVFDSWFKYLKDGKYAKEIEKLLKFKGGYRFNLPALRYRLNLLFPFGKRILIKDPIACLSSKWLSDHFDLCVVVVFRHPAAFYASLKRLNWRFDFKNLLDQKELMKDHLEPFRELMEKDKTFAEEASVLWLCLYTVLDRYISLNPDWIVKRHEDISLDPVGEFKDLYAKLGLDFTSEIEKKIMEYSSDENSVEARKELSLKRDSRGLADSWKKHVSEDELEIIQNITGKLLLKYYP